MNRESLAVPWGVKIGKSVRKFEEPLGTDLRESVGTLAEELDMNWGTVTQILIFVKIYVWENVARDLREKEEPARIWICSEIEKMLCLFCVTVINCDVTYILRYVPPPSPLKKSLFLAVENPTVS